MAKIDIEFIKKWVDISEEELMMRLVKDAVALQKEAETNERQAIIAERKADNDYDIEFVKNFLRNYNYLSEFFTDEEILTACQNNCGKTDLTSYEYLRRKIEDRKGFKFIRFEPHTFEEYRGTWKREVRDTAAVYLVPNSYQSLYTKNVFSELLLSKCPYLSDYTVELYDINDRNDWIFIKVPGGEGYCTSLYAPYSALIEKDAEKIAKAHQDYFHKYTCGKNDDEIKEFLDSDFVKEFLKKVVE